MKIAKRIFYIVILCTSLFTLTGCGNVSPWQRQQIQNQDGKIGNIESMANSMKAEIAKLQAQTEINRSKIGQLQEGLANIQTNYENSGIQILSGPGGIIISIVGIMAAFVLVAHYRTLYKQEEKTSEILAQAIAEKNDDELEENLFRAVMFTDVEENVLNLIKKYKQ